MQRVAVLSTGGTIEAIGKDRLDLAWYGENKARLPRGALIARIPELADIAEIVEVPFERSRSQDVAVPSLATLIRTLQDVARDGGVCGIVIMHGTNTLEETAFLLDLVLAADMPIVLVGAMRPSSALSTDADLNLVGAVRVACAPGAVGMGTLVVMNDSIFSARDVTKTSTHRVDAFASPNSGPLGYADSDGRVVFSHGRSARKGTAKFSIDTVDRFPRVDIVMSYAGADGVLIDAAVAAGARGVVTAGTGGGGVTAVEEAALDRAIAHGVLVCQASRVGSGRVVRSPSMERRGVVAAGDLPPWKARILLGLILGSAGDLDGAQAVFDQC